LFPPKSNEWSVTDCRGYFGGIYFFFGGNDFWQCIGYSYGKKKSTGRGLPKFYSELAGQEFWYELTGDDRFYVKLIRFMGKLPEKYIEDFEQSYQKASNRLVKEFTNEFCLENGSIDWEKLVEFNSGR
jgi:hypothetical protein